MGAVCDTSDEILGHQTCVVHCRAGVIDSGPALKQHSCQRSNLGQTENIFLEVPTPIDGCNAVSARPRSTTSGAVSLVWEDKPP